MLQGQSKWTPEIDETVRVNYALGVTASQCSALVYLKHGVMFTRNAIIGKAKRMGWPTITKPRGQSGATGNAYVQKINAAKRNVQRRPLSALGDAYASIAERELGTGLVATARGGYGLPWHLFPKVPKRTPRVVSSDEPKSRNVPLLKLKDADCRFPTSEDAEAAGRQFFCGREKQFGSSYCGFDHGICNGRAA